MLAKRLQKEISQLFQNPPDGCVVYPVGESLTELEAKVQPMASTPYERGTFKLAISCGDRYPNEPPNVRFVTPVYHPNIDNEGRICLNLLKMPPKVEETKNGGTNFFFRSLFLGLLGSFLWNCCRFGWYSDFACAA